LIDKKKLKKLFPNLTEEMEKGASKVHIDKYRRHADQEDHLTTRRWAGYSPEAVDFIRRCESEEQAEEIISYLERRGKITAESASELRKRLREEGLEGFGGKKVSDFYNREG